MASPLALRCFPSSLLLSILLAASLLVTLPSPAASLIATPITHPRSLILRTANNPSLSSPLPILINNISPRMPALELQALLAFKQLITLDPSAALLTWTNATSAVPPCLWNGIACNGNSSVVAIHLAGNQLQGSISPLLSQLPHLGNLSLGANNLSGPIPSSLRNCSSLLEIDLSDNFLTGSIPSDLGMLSSLKVLRLYNNSLTGPIPVSLANCSHLVELSLYSNSLVGSIPPELGTLRNLQMLALSFNYLDGIIPTSILTNCTALTELALSLNNLTGPIPSEIDHLTKLQQLWIDGNQLSGSIPAALGNLSNLNVLRMDNNNLTGSVPASLGKLASLSVLLSISYNHLTGPVPPELGNLSNLEVLTLRNNHLSGAIPAELGKLHNLHGLFLQSNMLSGTIPLQLARCSSLERLRLDNNMLQGSIPPELGQLQLLIQLYLDRNMLQGSIPTTFSNLSRLQDLSLGYTKLSGIIPETVASLGTLVFNFSMPHNFLTGPIPPELGGMIHVQQIDLSGNNLSGSIPATLTSCVNLVALNLSHNSLTGNIPDIWGSLKFFKQLDLSGNFFAGSIPASLATLTLLEYLNLSYNNLSGRIPTQGVFQHLEPSSFLSNQGLCGPPLSLVCLEAPATASESSPAKGPRREAMIMVIAFSSLLIVVIFIVWLRYFYCAGRCSKATQADQIVPMNSPGMSKQAPNLRRFSSQELEAATDNFSENNIIGTGAVSTVYRGALIIGAKEVEAAIKLLTIENREEACRSFLVELDTLGGIRHRNLVRILGYCQQENVIALVLELLSKGSLEKHLHTNEACKLSWRVRLQMALGVAHALDYLHDGLRKPIVHRDLKPSNILLTEDMEAKVADFGIAKLLGPDTFYSTGWKSSCTLKGSLGYIAPEYAESTRVDPKGDVYSYGIVVLEMLTRRQPTDEMFRKMGGSLPSWVRGAYPERCWEVLDPELREAGDGDGDEEEVLELVEVGLECVEANPERRPRMGAVVTKIAAIVSSAQCKASGHSRDGDSCRTGS